MKVLSADVIFMTVAVPVITFFVGSFVYLGIVFSGGRSFEYRCTTQGVLESQEQVLGVAVGGWRPTDSDQACL